MTSLGTRIRSSQIWRSVVRHGLPAGRSGRALAVVSNLFLHIHPVEMRRHSLRLWFTWGMGWLAFVLFVIEVITGVALMFYYRPAAEHAYADMQALRAQVPFGLVREVHRWAGHAMVIAVWLHMLRVFLTGSYKQPREFNWCVGVLLLVLTMLLSFTGYLLPWDQLALWAVTVGTSMVAAAPLIGREGPGGGWLADGWDIRSLLLGGSAVGPAALLRFYVLHCAALPVLSVVFIGLHFWRVRKDGGISGPEPDQPVEAARSRKTKLPATLAAIVLAALAITTILACTDGLKGFFNTFSRPERLLPAFTLLLILGLLTYRVWTRPIPAAAIGLGCLGVYIASARDPNLLRILIEPDNVAISLMLAASLGFVWLAMRRMAINDDRNRRGLPPFETEDDQRVMVWPNVLMVELIIVVIATAALIIWAILCPAPLEAPANPAVVPNPSKAPWYFVGLQELLVYFDPWVAGCLLPVLIVVGLCALPYLDINPRGNGYYTLAERPFAITVFLFGFLVLWMLPILIGTFLRGPNWSLFGPFEPWDVHKVTTAGGINLSDAFWNGLLGRPLSPAGSTGMHWLLREAPGLVGLAACVLGIPVILKRTRLRSALSRLGHARYVVLMSLMTAMILVPTKMLLRWVFHVKYIVAIPEIPFNI